MSFNADHFFCVVNSVVLSRMVAVLSVLDARFLSSGATGIIGGTEGRSMLAMRRKHPICNTQGLKATAATVASSHHSQGLYIKCIITLWMPSWLHSLSYSIVVYSKHFTLV